MHVGSSGLSKRLSRESAWRSSGPGRLQVGRQLSSTYQRVVRDDAIQPNHEPSHLIHIRNTQIGTQVIPQHTHAPEFSVYYHWPSGFPRWRQIAIQSTTCDYPISPLATVVRAVLRDEISMEQQCSPNTGQNAAGCCISASSSMHLQQSTPPRPAATNPAPGKLSCTS